MEPPFCTNGSAGYLMQLSVNVIVHNTWALRKSDVLSNINNKINKIQQCC